MKIERSEAVEFLVALGFNKATKWDKEKIAAKLALVPDKVAEADVPEGHEVFYRKLVKAEGKVEFDSAPAEKADAGKGEAAPEGTTKAAAKEEKKEPSKAKAKKDAAPVKPKVEVDEFGCRIGTLANKVNEAIGEAAAALKKAKKENPASEEGWANEEDISKIAGVSMVQTRDRLYFGATKGQFESRRLIQYRVKKVEAKG